MSDARELVEDDFEVFYYLAGQHVGRREVFRVFEALVLEPEDSEIHLVALDGGAALALIGHLH